MGQRAIVLANGVIEDADVIRARLAGWKDAQVIAADAGSRHADRLGLTLDVILGDFDSTGWQQRAVYESQGVKTISAPAEKDETDLELALLYALESRVETIVVLGAFGGRVDMSLANVLLLTHPRLIDKQVFLWEGAQTAWMLRPPGGEVRGEIGDTVSLIPLDGASEGVTTHHLQYALTNEILRFGPARGLSNVMTATNAKVEILDGYLLIVHTPGRA